MKKYPDRHFSVHLKENTPSATATLGEAPTDGGPLVPWREVMDEIAAEGVPWGIVEAEVVPDSLEPLIASRRFLEKLKV